MKVLLALGLNLLLLWWLSGWLRRQWQTPGMGRWLVAAAVFKVLVTGVVVLYPSEDATYYQRWGLLLYQDASAHPMAWLRALGQDELHLGPYELITRGFSNTLFVVKLLSVLNFASGGLAWLNGAYFSLFSVVAAWWLVQVLARWRPAAAPAAGVAFLSWPSVVFWTSGITKEALFVGSAAALLAVVLAQAYRPPGSQRPQWLRLLAMLVLAGMVFKMRYFFAVFFLTALAVLLVVAEARRRGWLQRRWQQVAVLAGVLALGAGLAGRVSEVFTAEKFAQELMINYETLLQRSANRPHLEYPGLQPTPGSVGRYAPLAAWNTLARPYPWETLRLKYLIAGLENVLLLALLGLALVAVLRRQPGPLPFALVLTLGFYCGVVAVLVGLTTPNLGTMHRYRVSFLPFLLLLLLSSGYVAQWLRTRPWLRR